MVKLNQASQQNLYKQILLRLQEMLKLVKLQDKPENRRSIANYCQELSDLGKKVKIPGLVELVETSKIAIGEKNNPYQATVKQIIKELKQAGELILASDYDKIEASRDLQALVPLSSWKLSDVKKALLELEPEAVEEKEKQKPIRQKSIASDPWQEKESSVSEKNLSKNTEEKENTDEILSLFEELEENVKQESNSVEKKSEFSEEISDLFEDYFSEEGEPENSWLDIEEVEEKEEKNFIEALEVEEKIPNKIGKLTEELLGIFSEENEDFTIIDAFEDSYSSSSQMKLEELEDLLKDTNFYIENGQEETEETIEYYEHIDELNVLIEAKVTGNDEQKEKTVNFEELAELIESSSEPKVNIAAAIELEDLDKEEALEENLSKKAIVPESAAKLMAANQKGKFVEQTMRVPVKHLDNLNHLIGELVVKRNKLESDQERLRQFLDNLLSHVQGAE